MHVWGALPRRGLSVRRAAVVAAVAEVVVVVFIAKYEDNGSSLGSGRRDLPDVDRNRIRRYARSAGGFPRGWSGGGCRRSVWKAFLGIPRFLGS